MKTVRVALEEKAIELGALQKPDELAGLIDFVRSRPEMKTVLEIGTAKGGTLWVWCRLAALDALLLSVDMPGAKFGLPHSPQDDYRISTFPNPDQKLKLLRGDSHHPAMRNAVERTLDGREVDFLMIDGDHTLEGVTQDWEDYSPFVRSGGLIVFHDIVDHSEIACDCQVKPLWDELKEKHEYYEFIGAGESWGGIGVIVKA